MKKTAFLIVSLLLLGTFIYLLGQNASWKSQVKQEVEQVKVLSSQFQTHFSTPLAKEASAPWLAYAKAE